MPLDFPWERVILAVLTAAAAIWAAAKVAAPRVGAFMEKYILRVSEQRHVLAEDESERSTVILRTALQNSAFMGDQLTQITADLLSEGTDARRHFREEYTKMAQAVIGNTMTKEDYMGLIAMMQSFTLRLEAVEVAVKGISSGGSNSNLVSSPSPSGAGETETPDVILGAEEAQ